MTARFTKYTMAAMAIILSATVFAGGRNPHEQFGGEIPVDTIIMVDNIQVTAIKQGRVLRDQPLSATVLDAGMIERQHVTALKEASLTVPNFYIPDYGSRMTSSIYVRGLGARIDHPVVGINIDNVPLMN